MGRGPRRAGADVAHLILTVTDNGVGDLYVACAGPTGLTGGEAVVIAGTSVAAYNGGSGTAFPDRPDTFVLVGVAYTANAAGGTWRLA